jgi:hypothetical protein
VGQQLIGERHCVGEVVALERQPEQRPDCLPFESIGVGKRRPAVIKANVSKWTAQAVM